MSTMLAAETGVLGRTVRAVRSTSRSQWLVRGGIVAGAVLAAAVTMTTPGLPLVGLAFLAGVAGVGLAIAPQAPVGPVFPLLIMLAWLDRLDEVFDPRVVIVAAALIMVQLGTAAAASAPPQLPIPLRVLRPYLVALVVLIMLSGLTAVLVRVVLDAQGRGNFVLGVVIMVVTAGALLVAVGLRPRPAESPSGDEAASRRTGQRTVGAVAG